MKHTDYFDLKRKSLLRGGSTTPTKEGSALLLTLMVVSLLMFLVLSFVIYVRMELREVNNRQQLMQAQANAKLGAELAVSRLQIAAGPDTRVTAPIETASLTSANQRLIGQVVDAGAYRRVTPGGPLVYNPTYGQALDYLLSYDPNATFDPSAYMPFEADGRVKSGNALLVGPGSVTVNKDEDGNGIPDDFVAAPIRSAGKNGANSASGNYSWWIEDQGLKIQLNVTDQIFADTGSMANREQALTAQRIGSEVLLENYDPTDNAQNQLLEQVITLGQFKLTPMAPSGRDFLKENYHAVSLQNLGLPTNTRRGGLQRDLTAVFSEAEANGGDVDLTDPQFSELLDFQEDRIKRYRDESMALANLSFKPSGLNERHWNAMQVFTLRNDQAFSEFKDRIFPPMTDMHTQWDLGGATWRQLVTWVTQLQRYPNSNGVPPGIRWLDEMRLSPVVARVSVANYVTLDYPDAAFHWIPTVTLWNPYSVPLVMDSSRPWRVLLNMDSAVLGGYWLRLKVKNSKWSAPLISRYSHIQPRDELWTPKFRLNWDSKSDANFVLLIRDENGGTDVVIPPGEALMFAMHEHTELSPDGSGKIDTNIEVRMGLHDYGQFSVYTITDLEDQIFQDEMQYVLDDKGNWRLKSGSNGVDDINEHNPNNYSEASGGYNEWHSTNERSRKYGGVVTSHLPYPFPLDPSLLAQTDKVGLLTKVPPPEDMDICINRNGLDGWQILQVGVEVGRHNEDDKGNIEIRSGFRNLRISLDAGNDNWPMVEVMHPNQDIPHVIHSARSYDGDAGRDEIFTPWAPIGIPGKNDAFDPGTPGFPSMGLSYGLRLPEHGYLFNSANTNGANISASIRWLQDFNPLAPFQNRDPSSRMEKDKGWRNSRRGFESAPLYVGGFFMGDNRYGDLSWSTPNNKNQFMGHSDETLPGYTPGDIPKAILVEVPDGSEDIVSAASLMHAPLYSRRHALHPQDPKALTVHYIGDDNNANAVTYTIANVNAHSGYAQPVHMIGNSQAHFLVSRDRAEQSFYPSPAYSSPESQPPYAVTNSPVDYANERETYLAMYDYSWVYNEAIWDDFFFTPESNTRLQWQPPYRPDDRDFVTSAENVLIQGAFNVNSTSVAAWAALLYSMMGVDLETGDETEGYSAYSRFLNPQGTAFKPDEDDFTSANAYLGYRRLTAGEIWNNNGTPENESDDTGLAVEIVEQVKLRGPFLSMSDFVNRALVASTSDPDGLGISGALQSALDQSGINRDMGDPAFPESWIEGNVQYEVGDSFYELHSENVDGPRNAGAPGTLMQGDLLSRLGSVLRPRSDTFTIRSYGSVGDADDPLAQAWCELTVQRVADFVDPVRNDPGDDMDILHPVNATFGRKFKVISFRWLNDEEI